MTTAMDYLLLFISMALLAAAGIMLLATTRKNKVIMEMLKSSPSDSANEARDGRILEEEPPNLKDKDLVDLKDRLLDLFEREKLYRNPDIRVGDVAARLCTNKSYLAQAIRLKTNKNFCQLVHSFRVREAMRLFEENPDLTIRQLSSTVGFNSMTTFNSAFSRITGFTPAEWCREHKKKIAQ